MHVLGHSFSQRRKSSTRRPRDLHIRKVSFSGSSLSSGCSLDSTSTATSSTFTARSERLGLEAPSHAPPRLQDRPYISPQRDLFEEAATFYDDGDSDSDEDEDDSSSTVEQLVKERQSSWDTQARPMKLPPHASTPDHDDTQGEQPMDYFLLQFEKRPPLPRSHWSTSTIQTIDQRTPGSGATVATPGSTRLDDYFFDSHDDNDDEDEEDLVSNGMNGSAESVGTPQVLMATVATTVQAPTPQRPPFKMVGSVEDYMKRGGWKRKGVVFDKGEVDAEDE